MAHRGLGGAFHHRHSPFCALRCKGVEHRDGAGAHGKVCILFRRTEHGVGHQAVIAGDEGVGKREAGGAASAVQREFGGLYGSICGTHLNISYAAEIGKPAGRGVYAPGRHPYTVSGHVHVAVRSNVHALADAFLAGRRLGHKRQDEYD